MKPVVVAIDMGYGHLRPADAMSTALATVTLELDRLPLAGPAEQARWAGIRRFYERVSRLSQTPIVGWPLRGLLDGITRIPPLHPERDLSAPTWAARLMERQLASGLGGDLVAYLENAAAPLLTTFYAPALVAAFHRLERVYCVVTDTDINRVWVPLDPRRSPVTYFAPCARVARRLVAYGVAPEHVELTGFPLPGELLGGPTLPALRKNLAARLVRLDPERRFIGPHRATIERELHQPLSDEPAAAPLVTFAVGGAGAQAGMVDAFLGNLADALRCGRLRLALVAGVREEVAEHFRAAIVRHGLEGSDHVRVLLEPDIKSYFESFNALIAETDVLWSKPSEITFFAALGLPLVCAPPVGAHEHYNRRWVVESGAGLEQREVHSAGDWLAEWLHDGTLAQAAWAGFTHLPSQGLYKILDRVSKE